MSVSNICNDIFTTFTHLITLVIRESSYRNRIRLLLYNDHPPLPSFRSSTLRILNLRLQTFDDCLYLLDGRFNQLHTLIVDLAHLHRSDKILNQVSFARKIFVVK
jgi:hypothetical protein